MTLLLRHESTETLIALLLLDVAKTIDLASMA